MNVFTECLREHVEGGIRGMEDLSRDDLQELTGLYLSTIDYDESSTLLISIDKEKNYLFMSISMLTGCSGAEDFGLKVIDDLVEYYFEDIETHLDEMLIEAKRREVWNENRINIHLDNKERAADMRDEGKTIS